MADVDADYLKGHYLRSKTFQSKDFSYFCTRLSMSFAVFITKPKPCYRISHVGKERSFGMHGNVTVFGAYVDNSIDRWQFLMSSRLQIIRREVDLPHPEGPRNDELCL